jgi:hypothetical protein
MKRTDRIRPWWIAAALAALLAAGAAHGGSILFIGNSFTFAFGSPVRYYRPDTVTDLNSEGQGGVPALFKSFANQAGLHYEVYLETAPGIGIDWHLQHKLAAIGQKPWDIVVMHGYSTLDHGKPGDPQLLIRSVQEMAAFLRTRNPKVQLRLLATWPRADQTYLPGGAWYGKPIDAMAKAVRRGYDLAAKAAPAVNAVVPVGDAWVRAMRTGVADSNPYDGIDAGKMNLWSYDSYHASTYGTYLETLVVFGSVTGLDPRVLGAGECSGYELGLSAAQVSALQQVAYDQMAAEGSFKAAATPATAPAAAPPATAPPAKCTAPH